MNNLIYSVMNALDYIFNNMMRNDGMKHFIIGVVLASILKVFLPDIFVFVVLFVILVAKVLVYDEKMSQGTPKLKDLYWGIIGLVFGLF